MNDLRELCRVMRYDLSSINVESTSSPVKVEASTSHPEQNVKTEHDVKVKQEPITPPPLPAEEDFSTTELGWYD